jgi:hypothetical protein
MRTVGAPSRFTTRLGSLMKLDEASAGIAFTSLNGMSYSASK